MLHISELLQGDKSTDHRLRMTDAFFYYWSWFFVLVFYKHILQTYPSHCTTSQRAQDSEYTVTFHYQHYIGACLVISGNANLGDVHNREIKCKTKKWLCLWVLHG